MGSGSSAKKYKGELPDELVKKPPPAADSSEPQRDDEPTPPTSPKEDWRSPKPEAAPSKSSPRLASKRSTVSEPLQSVSESELLSPNEEFKRAASHGVPDLREPVVVVASVLSPTSRDHSDDEPKPRARRSERSPASGSPAPSKRMSMPPNMGSSQEALVPRLGSKPRHRHSVDNVTALEPLPERSRSKGSLEITALPLANESGTNNRASKRDDQVPAEFQKFGDKDGAPHEVHHRRPSRASFMEPRLSLEHRASISVERGDSESLERRGSKSGMRKSIPGTDLAGDLLSQDQHSRRSSKSAVTDELARRGSKQSVVSVSESRRESRRGSKIAYLQEEQLPPLSIGDRVTAADGPDADGPWRDMGHGTVEAFSEKEGKVLVRFETGDAFELRAKNLVNLALKQQMDSRNASKQKTDTSELAYDPYRGIEVGDHVAFSNGGRGVVVKHAATEGMVLVQCGQLGVRSVSCNQVTKVRGKEETDHAADAWKASFVNPGQKQVYQLSLAEAMGTFNEQVNWEQEKYKLEEEAKTYVDPSDPMKGFRIGEFVFVDDHGPWHEMGIGLIRGPGDKFGTVMVQFDVAGDTWMLKVDMLTKTAPPADTKWQKIRDPKGNDKRKPSIMVS